MSTVTLSIKNSAEILDHLVYVRYNHDGLKSLFSTSVYGQIEDFNWVIRRGRKQIDERNPFRKTIPGYTTKNRMILKVVEDVYTALEKGMKDGDLSCRNIKSIYQSMFNSNEIGTINEGIDLICSLYDHELSKSSINNYNIILRKHILGYSSFYNQSIGFTDLNFDFELKFKKYLSNETGLKKNSIDNQIKYLKSLCRKVEKQGIEVNPNVYLYKRDKEDKSIIYLNKQELDKLVESQLQDERLECQKDIFIIQCFTGLRISDLKELNIKRILEEGLISKRSKKTNTAINVPVLPKVREILTKYLDGLPLVTDQKYNQAIHEFLKKMNFNRIVDDSGKMLYEAATSHTARKSFITYCLNNTKLSIPEVALITGTSKEVISKHYAGADLFEIRNKLDLT